MPTIQYCVVDYATMTLSIELVECVSVSVAEQECRSVVGFGLLTSTMKISNFSYPSLHWLLCCHHHLHCYWHLLLLLQMQMKMQRRRRLLLLQL